MGPNSAPGCDEPTSRCQTSPSMWTLGGDQPVIPRVALSVERRHFHSHTAGSLTPTFVTARPVSLAVRLAFAFTLKSMVSIHAERTFERLRYLFGGDRPSQTARLTMSPDSIQSHRLEFQHLKSGIPRSTPHKLTPMVPCLPPILYMKYRNSILSCSKAPWGLSV